MYNFFQVNIESENTASGITVERFGEKLKLRAKKEVILAAGTIGSPQILLLSGVGPKDQLESHKIDVQHDLPGVGQNLQDHVMVSLWVVSDNSNKVGIDPFQVFNPVNHFKYFVFGKGPLTSNGIEAGGFLRTNVSNKDPYKRPDVQFHTLSATMAVDFGLKYKDALNIKDDVFYGAYGEYNGR